MAIVKAKENGALGGFLDKLENLENLTKEELTDFSVKVRKIANKI